MLSEIRLDKFQGFGQPARIPLKPFTLIYGPNASGKSSILRAILLAKQSLPRDSLSVLSYSGFDGFVFEGELVSLASFANVVYRHETSLALGLGLSLKVSENPRAMRSNLSKSLKVVSFDWTIEESVPFSEVSISFEFSGTSAPLNIAFRREDARLVVQQVTGVEENWGILSGHTTRRQQVRNDSMSKKSGGNHTVTDVNLEQFRASDFRHLKFLILGNLPRVSAANESGVGLNEGPKQIQLELLEELVQIARSTLNQNISDVRHIKPLREIDKRFSYEGEDLVGDLDHRDEYKSETLEVISKWISDLTNKRYEYRTITYRAEEVKYLGKMTSQILIDTLTDTPVSFRDVGVGLSQIKPILESLAVLTSGPKKLLLIEQPELHLHPRMQADLAGLLAKFIQSNPNVQIIAETHSESMLLRIQKYLRDGVLDKDNIQILYADQSFNDQIPGNFITEIDIAEENGFDFDLPASFTELRFRDLI